MSKTATPSQVRRSAEAAVSGLPPLMVAAERLAASVAMGDHGRRRAGVGEDFWQYRQALPGDVLANVDWRRSGRSDTAFIREREWESAHTVAVWADSASAMDYRSNRKLPSKRERANLLALAVSILLSKSGERVAFPSTIAAAPRSGERHLQRIARALTDTPSPRREYGNAPDFTGLKAAQSIFFSDFLGGDDRVFSALNSVAQSAGTGVLVQVLDETEEHFPFDGRVIFESMGGGMSFETHRAKGLQDQYRTRFAARCDKLQEFAHKSGWQYLKHHTSDDPRAALLWLHMAIGDRR